MAPENIRQAGSESVKSTETSESSAGELLNREDSPTGISTELVESDKRLQDVYELLNRGVRPESIAKKHGVSVSTIYRWKRQAVELYRESLEQTPVLDIISDHLMFLDQLERLTLYELEMLRPDGTMINADGTQAILDPLKARRLRLEYLKAAREIRKEKVTLQTTSGIIPRQPERIYTTIEREKSTAGTNENAVERSAEEIKQAIVGLLGQGRRMPKGDDK